MDLITKIAGLVGKEHRVQLYMPETVIVVQVIKAACGISILKGADRYMRSQKSTFNLMLHAQSFMAGAAREGAATVAGGGGGGGGGG
eukprot:CAMPEP_0173067924 /NCGR_PEP_ID=MMETSP1102-20130122/7108_1 /TAXON_ID=49646 /ORGANISM="Geminigera sp., Strain Caron Lab Isolate" /LENGTH=86 /DNA_ID=CAMNT_0013935689 /DNA_START=181 /DNA_END=438 /DNA_ORIENTATION=-